MYAGAHTAFVILSIAIYKIYFILIPIIPQTSFFSFSIHSSRPTIPHRSLRNSTSIRGRPQSIDTFASFIPPARHSSSPTLTQKANNMAPARPNPPKNTELTAKSKKPHTAGCQRQKRDSTTTVWIRCHHQRNVDGLLDCKCRLYSRRLVEFGRGMIWVGSHARDCACRMSAKGGVDLFGESCRFFAFE